MTRCGVGYLENIEGQRIGVGDEGADCGTSSRVLWVGQKGYSPLSEEVCV